MASTTRSNRVPTQESESKTPALRQAQGERTKRFPLMVSSDPVESPMKSDLSNHQKRRT